LFGQLYLASALLGAFGDLNGVNTSAMFIPVAGPFVEMAWPGGVPKDTEFIFVLDGLGQGAGIAMIVGGALWRTQVLEPDDRRSTRVSTRVLPVPYVSPHAAGMGLIGTF
jgi:hypothetical protein